MELPKLEPMTIGQILGRSFKVYGAHFWRFLGIVAVVYIPLALLRIPFALYWANEKTQGVGNNAGSGKLLVWSICLAMLGVLVSFLANAAIFKSVSGYYLGKKLTCREAYKSVWARFGTILAAAILLAVFLAFGFAVPFITFLLPYKFDILLSIWPIFLVLSVVAPLTVFVLVILWFAVTVQCIVAENLSAWQSFKRSRFLVGANKWRVFKLIIVLTAMSWILGWLSGKTWVLVGRRLVEQELAFRSIKYWISTVCGLLIGPIWAVATAHLYYDLKSRKERLETQVDAEVEAVKPWWETWPKSW